MRRMLCVSMVALTLMTSGLGAQGSPSGASPGAKNPTTARLIGIVPGAGHIYAGETGHGLAYLGGMAGILVVGGFVGAADCVAGGVYTDSTCPNDDGILNVTTVAVLGLWGWSIYDAGRAARRTNDKRGLRTSLILAPVRSPTLSDDASHGVRFGLSIATR